MARGIKVWLNVQYYGMQALSEAIAYSLALAPLAEAEVRKNPELEVLAPATLGILCFRAAPRGVKPETLDELNERILRDVNASGKFFISSTRVRGAFSLRICPIGHRTRRSDMVELIALVGDCVKAEGRGKKGRASDWCVGALPSSLFPGLPHLVTFLLMLNIDLTGKRALVAGVADDGGFGFAIAKALAEAGATVCVGTWPPALGIFRTCSSAASSTSRASSRAGS